MSNNICDICGSTEDVARHVSYEGKKVKQRYECLECFYKELAGSPYAEAYRERGWLDEKKS